MSESISNPSQPDQHTILADMFKQIISTMDPQTRQGLSQVVQYGHTRLNPNSSHHPIMFFSGHDQSRYNIARPHLQTLSQPSRAPSSTPFANHSQPQPINYTNSQLEERALYSKLSPDERTSYMQQRQTQYHNIFDGADHQWHDFASFQTSYPQMSHEQQMQPHQQQDEYHDHLVPDTDDEADDEYMSDDTASCFTDISHVTYESSHFANKMVKFPSEQTSPVFQR